MLAFIHLHKTGGTTLLWILRSTFGAKHCEIESLQKRPPGTFPWRTPITPQDVLLAKKIYPKLLSIGGHQVQPHANLEASGVQFKYFTVIRDPIKMRASNYQHGVSVLGEERLPFEEWVRDEDTSNRFTRMLAGKADADEAIRIIQQKNIFVGLTERFDESLILLNHWLGGTLKLMYRPMRVASNRAVAKQLLSSQKSRLMLIQSNEEDMKVYEWVKNDLYPTYQREYGKSLAEDVNRFQARLLPYQKKHVPVQFLQRSRLNKFFLLFDLTPFDRKNVFLSLMMKQLVYRPGLRLNRVLCKIA